VWLQGIKENAKKLFVNDDFIQCIVDGMKSSQAFVRYHYITFSEKIVCFMQENIETNDRVKFIQKLIQCFCHLLEQADVSQYSHHYDKEKRHNSQDEGALSSRVNGASTGHRIVINQENDIAQIIDGLKKIVNYCLDIHASGFNDDDLIERPKNAVQEPVERKKEGFLFGLIGSSKKGEEVRTNRIQSMILDEHMVAILLSVINCWNSVDCFTRSDNHFTRLGVFPYNSQDESNMHATIREEKAKIIKNID
jgi:hypothetical protein